jgi:transcriptional regulator with XRE-family HTH domain
VTENASVVGADSERSADSWGGRVDFAQRLTRLFEETKRPDGKRWTLQYVADECVARGQSVTKAYILHLKAGQRTEPRLSLVEALADVFRVPVTYFTADYAGRVTADLLPLLVAMQDSGLRRLLGRADATELAALSEPPLSGLVEIYGLAGLLARLSDAGVQEALTTASITADA